MSRIFVTGVAGFLGNHVARALIREGHEVSGCDNLLTGSRANLEQIHLAGESIRGIQYMNRPNVDLVVHCAAIPRSTWPDETDLWEHNVRATQVVLGWGVPVIYASSSTAANPTNLYGRTKLLSERMVLGAGGTALRFCNIYGPGQSEDDVVTVPNVLAAFRRQRETKGRVFVDGDGTKTRHWVHVTDAAQAVVAAVDTPLRGLWVDVCGERRSIGEMASAFGVPVVYGPDRPNDPQDMPQDPMPAKILLGWEPRVDLDAGVAEVVGN